MKDPYDVLGVPRNASAEAIKKTYRRLARQFHPDSSGGKAGGEDRFKDLSAAYELLSDSKKRASYDRGEIDADGNQIQRSGPFGGAYSSMGRGRGRSPFDDFFNRRDQRANGNIRINGADVTYTMKVSFIDAIRGASKNVSMTNGKHLTVTIPAGTNNGQVLRLRGQGMAGIGGGQDGDAHVEVLVMPDPLFRREGDNILIDCPVSLPEAILGARITVPTVYGQVTVTVPKGSNTGTTLRLKGKGVKNAKLKKSGDQLLTLKVILPKEPDRELREFIEKWAKKNTYDVRSGNAYCGSATGKANAG